MGGVDLVDQMVILYKHGKKNFVVAKGILSHAYGNRARFFHHIL